MQGASRGSLLKVRQELDTLLGSGTDTSALGDELFAVSGVLGSSASLRRALTDPTAEAAKKAARAQRRRERAGAAAPAKRLRSKAAATPNKRPPRPRPR